MRQLESIENQVKQLSPDELATFREWFAEFDAGQWDLQLEADARAEKLNHMAERALRDHAAGRSTKL